MLRALSIATVVLVHTFGAWSMQTDNHGLRAVPAPGPVKIDGQLDDWDLSGQALICYDVQSLKDIYSGRVAFMYDANSLYVSIRWKDPTPIGNSHDPRFQAHKGWAGDCVQLRLRTNRISHVTAWCFAREMEPFIHIDYGKSLTEPFGGGEKKLFRKQGWVLDEGAEMAFLKDADGRGYVQELKLPWPLIANDGKVYSAGESFRCGIELLWGEADWPVHRYADNLADGATSREFFWTAKDAWGEVKLEEKGRLALPVPPWEQALAEEKPEGSVRIRYELPKEARVTLAIDDAGGRRVRNLLAAAERGKGAQEEVWDGMDDRGNILPPGTYTVKGLYHDGLRLTYALSYASPGKPGWKTADGKGAFYGDHTAPQAVAAGKDRMALACPMGEAGEHLIGVDLAGQRQWGMANRAAFGGGRISLATDGRILWIANGDGDEKGTGRFTIWRCELATGKYAPWKRRDAEGKDVLDLEIAPKDGIPNVRTIAWHAGKLAVIVARERRFLILDSETGDTLKEWKDFPERMAACAYAPDGSLYLAAGTALHRVNAGDGSLQKLFEGLDEPQGLACGADGQFYVSQRGAKQCVEVFDATGKVLRTIGKVGGRGEEGAFDETGMHRPAQIALDSQGRLWVAEESYQPKRTSVWAPDGRLAFDLIGTTAYAAGGQINPFDRRRGFSEMVEYALDYERQTFRPIFTLPDALKTGMFMVLKFARIDGREYIQASGTARDAGQVKIYLRRPDGSWRHVAEFGNVGEGRSLDDPGVGEWNQKFKQPVFQGHFGKAFLWVDRNGDGQAQPEEMQTRPARFGRYYWGQAMGSDLTVTIPLRGSKDLQVFKPQGFTPDGTPLYSFENATKIAPQGDLGGEGMLATGRDGRLYLNQSPLAAIAPDGKFLWTYPNDYVSVHGSHRAPAPAPGLLIGPSSIYGTAFVNEEIGEVFYLNGNLGQNFIFTEDGLWVQSLYNDCRGWFDVPQQATPGMPCDAMTAGGESFGGGFCRSDDGKYYTVGGGTAAIVMELHGLDSLKRFGATAQMTEADVAEAQQIKIRRAARKMAPKVYAVKAAMTPLPCDGSLDAWDMDKHVIEIQSGNQKVATIKAAYDAENLYLGYKVQDSSPLKNAGQNEQLMFIAGDGVDLMLRADAEAKGEQPTRGDLRLLLTVKEGRPLAVLYEAVVPDTKPEERVAFSSPWRTIHFDRVRTVSFPLALKPCPGGYAVTAAVPLKLLGIDSLKGKTLRGDFGVLGSDSAGQECTSRNYWSNKTTNNTNDVPDEALLAPALWGTLTFE